MHRCHGPGVLRAQKSRKTSSKRNTSILDKSQDIELRIPEQHGGFVPCVWGGGARISIHVGESQGAVMFPFHNQGGHAVHSEA